MSTIPMQTCPAKTTEEIQREIDTRRALALESMKLRGWSFPQGIVPLSLLLDIEAERIGLHDLACTMHVANEKQAEEIDQLRENVRTLVAERDDAMVGRSTCGKPIAWDHARNGGKDSKPCMRPPEHDGICYSRAECDPDQMAARVADARSAALAALREAGIETDGPAAGVRELAAQRDEALRDERAAVVAYLRSRATMGHLIERATGDNRAIEIERGLHRPATPPAPPKEPAPEPRQSNCMACGGSGVQSDALTGAVWDCICRKPRPAPVPEPAPELRGNGPACPGCGWANNTLRKRCRNCSADLVMHPDPEIDHEVRMDADDGRRSDAPRTPEAAEPAPTAPLLAWRQRLAESFDADARVAMENMHRLRRGEDVHILSDGLGGVTWEVRADERRKAAIKVRATSLPVPAPEPAPPLAEWARERVAASMAETWPQHCIDSDCPMAGCEREAAARADERAKVTALLTSNTARELAVGRHLTDDEWAEINFARSVRDCEQRNDERIRVRQSIADALLPLVGMPLNPIVVENIAAGVLGAYVAPVCRCGHDRGSHPTGPCECCTEPGSPRCPCFTVEG